MDVQEFAPEISAMQLPNKSGSALTRTELLLTENGTTMCEKLVKPTLPHVSH